MNEVEYLQINEDNIMKKWYKSWTIWFNLALLAVEVIGQINLIVPLPPELIVWAGLAGNFLLRFKTSKAVI